MVGLVVAPVVAGNTIVLKPASTSSIIAAKFMEVLESVGVPTAWSISCLAPAAALATRWWITR